MKRFFVFCKKNPMFVLLSLVSLAIAFFADEQAGLSLAMATVVAPGGVRASKGIGGLASHGAGDATTVSNASELSPGFIDSEVDDQIVSIASDESIKPHICIQKSVYGTSTNSRRVNILLSSISTSMRSAFFRLSLSPRRIITIPSKWLFIISMA